MLDLVLVLCRLLFPVSFYLLILLFFTNYIKRTHLQMGRTLSGPQWQVANYRSARFMICFIAWRIFFFKENAFSKPGGGQRGRAEAEVRAARQWGDRNPPEGCSQLHDRPWQGAGYRPPIQPSTTHSTFFMHAFERSPLPTCFFFLIPLAQSQCSQSILFSPCLSSQGATSEALLSFLFLFCLLHLFFCPILLSKVDIFEREALSVWCLTAVAPVAQMYAWAEHKSQVLTSSHLIVCFSDF